MRAHLATCTRTRHAEIAELGAVIPALAEMRPDRRAAGGAEGAGSWPPPPPTLRHAVARPARRRQAADASRRPAAGSRRARRLPERGRARARAVREPSSGTWVLRIAAVLAIALLGGWNLLLQNDLERGSPIRAERRPPCSTRPPSRASLTAVLVAEGGAGVRPGRGRSGRRPSRIAMRDLAPTSGTRSTRRG